MKLHTLAFVAMAMMMGEVVAGPIDVSVGPAKPLIEQGKGQQLLNIDFLIKNDSQDKVELSEIEVSVLGEAGKLVAQYRVGANGRSVFVVPNRFIEPGKSELVFNPLYAFPQDLDLSRLRYTFKFDVGDDTKYTIEVPVAPILYKTKAQLQLPVAGPVLVHDGHDFYGHHRRLPLLDPMAQALKWKRNFMRYSYDFVVTDEQGRMYKGDGLRNEDWYGWGKPILAPAGGKVIRAVSAIPDNAKDKGPSFGKDQFIADPSIMWGNHVEIEHGNGEISLLAHMKQGSVTVKVGDTVKAGQKVGEMGFSGDAFLVHLHYDLKDAPGFDADALPSPFNNFERLTGKRWLKVKQGQVDSGDVVRRLP
ncbi:peptidoglycan DD-metalloendopeptidase family protein [Pseudoduganella eburnea]|uniref:Peptidoglycan DD-metalloendopeptidase family protein n=1 Tax=Massilia eburnea TaxID=1776165 RepID=A0A6L6QC36_9BURK|nr:M23 family metallopeptidase [Massilia eburnea]MTW09293.1 peptidoglycan DD-metalloendopeptidase family protein [Massilia eburnea]